ncbi:MAG: hypothetical protein A2493_03725 [Candidatus Magasanikbacteria bacterium RIFOXYC12_FULL_33_11]|uniref:Tim44-like domain-containing protein n=1 Tax=Candidatus Magasanikbacteria bacterium RIFOXYC12_FULL_33_11 TaxID=1798701 RepID=A0A1F6NR45_9BACT|nr:MAG: hypothetical protein A2493_03725 [Candidatus Magasanikbacteria bacterium RIFOXYC12_FULL_33_11]
MLTLRQKIFISAGVISAFIIIAFLVVFYIKANDKNNTQNNTNSNIVVNENVIDANNPNNVLTPINNQTDENIVKPEGTPEELFVKQMAKIFVERFFTYSNQNDNVHITELEETVTPKMLSWMQTQMKEKGQNYSGMTTRVISSSLVNFDKVIGVAKVSLGVEETISQDVEDSLQQEKLQKIFEVDFVLVNNDWKVDGVWDKTDAN